ncbi:MAG: hypothetical protein O7A69_04260 [SAR324 cluster bacterium]|nr:hypothetical protein [SAR324 cluster bacterium]MCZ6645357.1 hypothetical protein [SAR324 cluster bacterium]
MAEQNENRAFTTVYEDQDTPAGISGTLAFARRQEIDAEVVSYLEVVEQLKKDFEDDPQVVSGLNDLEGSLGALRVSGQSEQELQKKLHALIEVPIAEGKTLRLDAFRKSTTDSLLKDNEAYRARVRKLVCNTQGNLTHLLLTWPDDNILQLFLRELNELKFDGDFDALKQQMEGVGKSPHLWHYNDRKKEFLMEWLRPFQEHFGKPIEELKPEELQASIQKVESLRNTKLEEMTHLSVEADKAPFRPYNRKMHPIMNGNNLEFWGSEEVRDEFIALLNKLITRFSLNLEEHFLTFKTQDDGFAYLVGFADEAFAKAVEMKDGGLGIYPHLKVFLKGSDGKFAEIRQEAYSGNSSAYYQALRTATVPFLASMAVMLETVLSGSIKEAFDMWT